MISNKNKRLIPNMVFPDYAHVPGLTPHPKKKGGHSEFLEDPEPETMDEKKPYNSGDFLYAVDLFNHGFYWESHVWWEGLWHACGRKGVMGDFLKALIKLGAAGVKAKAKELKGVTLHSRRAQELFDGILDRGFNYYAGFYIQDLLTYSKDIELNAQRYCENSFPEGSVFDKYLIPDRN
tara:strand:+ start:115 stop:651 length:537 start_codon:yes stop_codon:yes gene_type:complete